MDNKKLFAGDCETDPALHGRIPQDFIWDIFDGEHHYTFDNVHDFMMMASTCDGIMVFHNLGGFDSYYMRDYIEPGTKPKIINNRLVSFQIGLCEFRDSLNIIPAKLEAYQKDKFDYSKMERKVRHLYMDEITEYLHHDTQYLYELVDAFYKEFGQALTIGTAAFNYLYDRILHEDKPDTPRSHYEQWSPYYYGGRTQAFKHRMAYGDIQSIDINSAYPYAMKQISHPYGTGYYEIEHDEEILPTDFVDLSCVSWGAFPKRHNGSLLFPHWESRFQVTGHEYLAAIELGWIDRVKLHHVYRFEDSIYLGEYVDIFYNKRLKAKKDKDAIGILLYKLLLNNLYGKYCQNPDNFLDYKFVGYRHKKAAEIREGYLPLMDFNKTSALCARPLSEYQARFYNVATGASITGYVRAMLLRAINGVHPQNMLYCDTDAISFIGEPPPLYQDENELGAWWVEAKGDSMAIGGKKLYAMMQGKKCTKKASKGAQLTPKQIRRLVNGATINYKNQFPTYPLNGIAKFIDRKLTATR